MLPPSLLLSLSMCIGKACTYCLLVPKIQKYLCIYKYAVRTIVRTHDRTHTQFIAQFHQHRALLFSFIDVVVAVLWLLLLPLILLRLLLILLVVIFPRLWVLFDLQTGYIAQVFVFI